MRIVCLLLGVGLIAWSIFRLLADAPVGVNGQPHRGDLLQLIFFFLQAGFGALLVYIAVFDPPDSGSADQQENGFGADVDIGDDDW